MRNSTKLSKEIREEADEMETKSKIPSAMDRIERPIAIRNPAWHLGYSELYEGPTMNGKPFIPPKPGQIGLLS